MSDNKLHLRASRSARGGVGVQVSLLVLLQGCAVPDGAEPGVTHERVWHEEAKLESLEPNVMQDWLRRLPDHFVVDACHALATDPRFERQDMDWLIEWLRGKSLPQEHEVWTSIWEMVQALKWDPRKVRRLEGGGFGADPVLAMRVARAFAASGDLTPEDVEWMSERGRAIESGRVHYPDQHFTEVFSRPYMQRLGRAMTMVSDLYVMRR